MRVAHIYGGHYNEWHGTGREYAIMYIHVSAWNKFEVHADVDHWLIIVETIGLISRQETYVGLKRAARRNVL